MLRCRPGAMTAGSERSPVPGGLVPFPSGEPVTVTGPLALFGPLARLVQGLQPLGEGLPAVGGDVLVEDAPELGRTRSVQNCLARQPGGDLLI
jgi:hypothetical protein